MNLDNPISGAGEDLLGRAALAQEFGRIIMSLRCEQGAVVAVLGPWGSGKTSFLNMVRGELEAAKVTVLEFNPWMYSGTSELVERFYIEIGQQLRRTAHLASLGKQIEKYMATFPGVIGGTSRVVGRILQSGDPHARVVKTLEDLDKPIVVFVDDIDRLSSHELKDVFRLVRLTCCLPNVLYVLAFDRQRAETALTEEGLPGRDYMEKIVQWSVDLPEIPPTLLRGAVIKEIESALEGVDSLGVMDREAWASVSHDVVFPLIHNMRDVRRYSVAVRAAAILLGGNVQLADILGLEAIRTFLPDVFGKLHGLRDALTQPQGVAVDTERRRNEYRQQLEELIGGETRKGIVEAMVNELFPGAGTYIGSMSYGDEWPSKWLKERRVAHHSVLSFYLERFENAGMTAIRQAEAAFACMTDAAAFEAHLRSLDQDKVEDVIRALENLEGDFGLEHVVPGATVLLNHQWKLPERARGFFDFGSGVVVSRVVYRLLRAVSGGDQVECAVAAILPALESLASQLRLIQMVGHREGVGHGLVTEQCAAKLEQVWRRTVREASPAMLVAEPDLLRVLVTVDAESDAHEPELDIEFSPELTRTLLTSALSETLESRGRLVDRKQRLAWDSLVRIYGDEAKLVRSIDELDVGTVDQGLLELARKYGRGWRPSDFE